MSKQIRISDELVDILSRLPGGTYNEKIYFLVGRQQGRTEEKTSSEPLTPYKIIPEPRLTPDGIQALEKKT